MKTSSLRSVLFVAAAFLFATTPLPSHAAGGVLEAWIIDVGQGDAALISSPTGRTILVDAGPPENGGRVAHFLRAHVTGPLDLAVGTHPHTDHVGGMSAALRAVGVRAYYDVAPDPAHHTRLLATLDKTVATLGATHQHVDAGTPPLDLGDGTTVTVLSPLRPPLVDCTDRVNCNAIALLIRSGSQSILMAADIEGATENELLRTRKGALRATVLKVGHHGSRTATTTAWLRTVKPEIAVISVGVANAYHHPHPSTLHRLEAEGVRVYRTDKDGTIHVVLSGAVPSVTTSHGP